MVLDAFPAICRSIVIPAEAGIQTGMFFPGTRLSKMPLAVRGCDVCEDSSYTLQLAAG